MEWYKKYKSTIFKIIILVLILLDLVWSVGNEKNFFYWDKSYNPNSAMFYWVMKAIYTVFLCIIGVIVYKFFNNPVKYVSAIKEWFRYAWPILIVYGILIVMLWPGNWGAVADEVQVYLSVKNLRVWPDQGILSSAFMILCLMVYPKVWMITLVQGVISIVFIGDVIRKVVLELKCGRIQKWLFILLFVSPPALCFLLCPIRIWLYSVLLIAMIEYLFFLQKISDNREKQVYLIKIITVLCALVSNYRSEGILFIPVCLLVTLFCTKKITCKVRIAVIQLAVICIITLGLKGLTLLGNGKTLRQHSGITFITTLSMILSDDAEYALIDEEDINNINAVFDVQVLRDHPSMSAAFDGTRAERSFDEPTEEEMSAYMSSAIKLTLQNIPTFLACKWEAAKWSLGVYPYYRTVGTIWTQDILDQWNKYTDLPGNMSDDFRPYANDIVRERISELIVSYNVYNIDSFYIFYAFWVPCLLLPVTTLIYFIKRNWMEAFVCLAICVQLMMVIIMAPGRYQMYYLPFYFLGWFEVFRLKRCS